MSLGGQGVRPMSVDSLGDSAHTRRQHKGEGYKGYIGRRMP
ncbi:hypothetical protein [Candidatus Regiella insecticola]